MNDARSVQASPANKEGLTPAQIEAWREQGVVLVSELLPASLIESLRCLAEREFPAPGSEAALAVRDFGSGGRFVFPSKHAEFNQLTLHKALIKAVAVLLDIEPMALRLTQSDLWPKYGHTTQDARDNQDQRIHMDYPNHMLVHPPSWHSPATMEDSSTWVPDADPFAEASKICTKEASRSRRVSFGRVGFHRVRQAISGS